MALISREFSFIRNALGVIGLITLSPLILLALLAKVAIFPFERAAKRHPSYVIDRLRKFLNDEPDSDRFWDEFISVPLADPVLEDMRKEAAMIDLPINDADRQKLEALLARAEAVAGAGLSTGVQSRVH